MRRRSAMRSVEDENWPEAKGLQRIRRLPDANLGVLWDSIIVDDKLKTQLLSQAVLNFTLRGKVDRAVLPLHGAILLVGPPGTGKMSLARGLAHRTAEWGSARGSAGDTHRGAPQGHPPGVRPEASPRYPYRPDAPKDPPAEWVSLAESRSGCPWPRPVFPSIAHPLSSCAPVTRGADDQGGSVERNRCVGGERYRQSRGTGGLAVPGQLHAQESAHVTQGGAIPAARAAERTHQDGRNGAGARGRRCRRGGNTDADLGSTGVGRRGRQIEHQRGRVDGRARRLFTPSSVTPVARAISRIERPASTTRRWAVPLAGSSGTRDPCVVGTASRTRRGRRRRSAPSGSRPTVRSWRAGLMFPGRERHHSRVPGLCSPRPVWTNVPLSRRGDRCGRRPREDRG